MLRTEGFQRVQVARDCGRRDQLRKLQHQKFFWIIAHPKRIIHDQNIRSQKIQQMGGCDVAHVKGRILAQPNDVKLMKIQMLQRAKIHMIAVRASQHHFLSLGRDFAIFKGQPAGRMIINFMAARLGFHRQVKTAVCVNIDRFHRVHLKSNFS